MENDEWLQERPIVALSVIDQNLVDSLVKIVRELWITDSRESTTPDLAERDLDLLHRITYRR